MFKTIANARFGDDGKLWHIGAALLVGAVMWAIIIDVAFRLFGA